MKKFFLQCLSVVGMLAFATPVFAQGMMGEWAGYSNLPTDPALQQEESQGFELWQKLQRQEIVCSSLTDEQYDWLGEYFMSQMMGDAHAAMNARLRASLGDEGETQMHITLGKRLSGCDPNAVYTNSYLGFMPMMGMMFVNGSGWDGSYAFRSPMMQSMYTWYGSQGWSGWVIIILWWILIIAAVWVFLQWVFGLHTHHPGHNALEHIKIRYAKGEIDKKTFDRLKRELK